MMYPSKIGLGLIDGVEFFRRSFETSPLTGEVDPNKLYARITYPIVFCSNKTGREFFVDFLRDCFSHHQAERCRFMWSNGNVNFSVKQSERIEDLADTMESNWEDGGESFFLKHRRSNKRSGDSLQVKFTLSSGKIISTYLIVPYGFFEEYSHVSSLIAESGRESSSVYSVRGILYREDLAKFK